MTARIIQPVKEVVLWPRDAHYTVAAAGTFDNGAGTQTYDTLDFDQTTSEFATFGLICPSAARWGATVYWTASSGTGGVVWQLQGACTPSGGSLDTSDAAGSALNGTTLTSALILHATEIPIVENDSFRPGALINADLVRLPDNAADTLNADARFLALVVRFYS